MNRHQLGELLWYLFLLALILFLGRAFIAYAEITLKVPSLPMAPIARFEPEKPVESVLEATTGTVAVEEPRGNPVSCSCVLAARYFGLKLPKVRTPADLTPNTALPTIGDGIIFNYSGTPHIAVIKSFTPQGFVVDEGNFHRCQLTTRFVRYGDPKITGFYTEE